MNNTPLNNSMTCDEARAQFALLLYGELSFDEEDRVETHLDACADCRAALDREKVLHAALDGVAIEPPPSLLRECRADLAARLNWEPGAPQHQIGWWDRFTGWLTGGLTGGSGMVLRPAGALALMALGFFGARLTNTGSIGLSEAGMARVRDVRPGANGRVQITVDETRQRIVSGGLDEQPIKELLMEAARDPNDPGLRADSVDLLNSQVNSGVNSRVNAPAQSADIRDVLIFTLQHDQNTGVRFKAMDGLKAFAHEPEVRRALSETLLSDANPGIRAQAIDLLIQGSGENLDRQVIGTLQELMLREDNAGIKQRCQRVLASFNASPGIY
jgi:anti-sigma factor RsiW